MNLAPLCRRPSEFHSNNYLHQILSLQRNLHFPRENSLRGRTMSGIQPCGLDNILESSWVNFWAGIQRRELNSCLMVQLLPCVHIVVKVKILFRIVFEFQLQCCMNNCPFFSFLVLLQWTWGWRLLKKRDIITSWVF